MDTPETILAEQIATRLPHLSPEAQVSVTFSPRHPVQGPGLAVTVDGKSIITATWAEVAEFLVSGRKCLT